MKTRPAKLRSENLTVVFTDIVDFTATTAGQSRSANASLLHRHDNLLIPIALKFGGRRVKSIGDALLLVFRSSTDALLCAMAMQDSLYEHNREHRAEPEIHIRIAVNVGEVRVANKDVFGEAVNTAARLEGITPTDAIYLTEAVYMTMNRAEVPAQEVGSHHFKGVEAPVRVFQVPRFTATKLVPDSKSPTADVVDKQREGFAYPYGGIHLMNDLGHRGFDTGPWWRSPWVGAGVAALSLLVLAAFLWWPHSESPSQAPPQVAQRPPAQATPPIVRPPGTVVERLRERLGGSIGEPIRGRVQAFKIQVLLEQLWPWLVDDNRFVSPNRLRDAPLPLGNPLPDVEVGALPLPWADLDGAEQVLFSSLEGSWDSLEPAFQQHLVKTGRVWRGATSEQRRAVVEQIKAWSQVEGVDRTIAERRLDYLRSLDPGKRGEIIAQHNLALPLHGDREQGDGGSERDGRDGGAVPTAAVTSRVEPRPPPPQEPRPEPRRDYSGRDDGQSYGRQRTSQRPPSPPERGGQPPPPPPWEHDGHRPPPPPWEHDGGRPPPPPGDHRR